MPCHITSYIVNNIFGADTHMHTPAHMAIQASWIKAISRNQKHASQKPEHLVEEVGEQGAIDALK